MTWLVHKSFSFDDRHIPELKIEKCPSQWATLRWRDGRVDIGDEVIEAKLIYPRSYIPDLMSWNGITIVCDTFRQAVEEVEPERHQFAPAILHDEQGLPMRPALWGMNVLQYCEAVIVEKSRIKACPIPEEKQAAAKCMRTLDGGVTPYSLTLSKQAIGGRHLWRSREMHGYYFLSDTLMALVMDRRLRPIADFVPTKEE